MEDQELAQKKAVALKYEIERDNAPVVVAKGRGELAERIVNVARENKVAIREDPELVNYLYSIDLFEEIPPELYGVVAEIMVFVYNLDRKSGGRK